MPQWFRKLRAAVALGGMWGVSVTLISGVASAVSQFIGVGSVSGAAVLQAAMQAGFFGLVVGTAFAGTLVSFEGRNILERLKLWRIALWGALMGGTFPVIIELLEGGSVWAGLAEVPAVAGLCAVIGASLSTGTIVLAKSAKAELGAGDSRSERLAAASDEA